jgi:hypothetical protein
MPSERPEVAETYDKDVQFMINLENAMTGARQVMNALNRDWNNIDALTRQETMRRAHVIVTIDLYNRIKALAEPRGFLDQFEMDIAVHVKDMGKKPDAARIMDLYFQLLARYQFWMDKMGILLQNIPPNLFASALIEEMEEEYKAHQARSRALEARGRLQRQVAEAPGEDAPNEPVEAPEDESEDEEENDA